MSVTAPGLAAKAGGVQRRRLLGGASLSCAWLAAGCVQAPRTQEAGRTPGAFWSGRLSLVIQSEPPQSSSGGFELKGNARDGELSLFTPLGGTLAVLAWSPGTATLRNSANEVRNFESLDALALQATGTALPVPALFDWLAGTPTPVPGWEAELSRLAEGVLVAKRSDPAPAAVLRVILDK